MKDPVISIIVPCYNQAQYLSEALESVVNQSYSEWECIIINDGSLDNTHEIAKEWLQKDKRFRYEEINNGGLSNARNVGINEAIGEFILPLDADDKISENYIELAVEEFRKDPTLKVVYCKAEKFGHEHGSWKLNSYSLKRLAYINLIFCSALFRKEDWEKVGGYDLNMIYGWEDWEFWIALLKHGGVVKRIDHVGFYYRTKNESMIKNIDEKQKKEMLDYMSIKHVDFFVEQIGNFSDLVGKIYDDKKRFQNLLNSKKHAINVLLKPIFRKEIFRLKQQE